MKSIILHADIEDIEVRSHYSSNYMMPGFHYHDAYEIYALEAGHREYMVNNTFIKLEERDVVLIKPSMRHCFLSGEYTASSIHFSKGFMKKYFTDLFIERFTKCFDKEVIRVRSSDFNVLISLIEKLYENSDDCMSFMQLFILLDNNMDRVTKNYKKENHALYNIIDYINENYKYISSLFINS